MHLDKINLNNITFQRTKWIKNVCGSFAKCNRDCHCGQYIDVSWGGQEVMNPFPGGPRVVAGSAAFHARTRGSFLGLGGLKETKMFLPHPLVKLSIVGTSVSER